MHPPNKLMRSPETKARWLAPPFLRDAPHMGKPFFAVAIIILVVIVCLHAGETTCVTEATQQTHLHRFQTKGLI